MPPLPNTPSWRVAKLSNVYVYMAWCLIKHRGNFSLTLLFLSHQNINQRRVLDNSATSDGKWSEHICKNRLPVYHLYSFVSFPIVNVCTSSLRRQRPCPSYWWSEPSLQTHWTGLTESMTNCSQWDRERERERDALQTSLGRTRSVMRIRGLWVAIQLQRSRVSCATFQTRPPMIRNGCWLYARYGSKKTRRRQWKKSLFLGYTL
jgi:hypothetical protein